MVEAKSLRLFDIPLLPYDHYWQSLGMPKKKKERKKEKVIYVQLCLAQQYHVQEIPPELQTLVC